MDDSSWFACSNAGQRWSVGSRLAGPTGVFDLLPLLIGDERHLVIGHGVVLVRANIQYSVGTGSNAVPAAIAFVGINCDVVLPGTVLISVIRFHNDQSIRVIAPSFQIRIQ